MNDLPVTYKKSNPWLWIPTLFATEAIVSATVIYVVLLMFIQLGASYSKATLFTSILLWPSIAKLYLKWNRKWYPYLKNILICFGS